MVMNLQNSIMVIMVINLQIVTSIQAYESTGPHLYDCFWWGIFTERNALRDIEAHEVGALPRMGPCPQDIKGAHIFLHL